MTATFSGSQISHQRKRQRNEHFPLLPNGVTQPQAKRLKLDSQSAEPPSPSLFWDSLSKIWLTKRALIELDRRNTRVPLNNALHSSCRPRRPVTRRALIALRKSRQPSQSAVEILNYCTPTRLKDIKYFARHGGPDISDLRGHPEPINPSNSDMSSSRSSRGRKRGSASTPTTKSTTITKPTASTERSGPYDQNFRQKLIEGGVYPYGYEYPGGRGTPKPNNWAEINQRLTNYRPSLSPSIFTEEKHEEFQRAAARVSKENKATKKVIPLIEGNTTDDNCAEENILFTNLAPLTDYDLTAAKPDLYYGARPEMLQRQVRDDLSKHIIPSKQDHLPAAPNSFLEAKGPDGSGAVAGRQACYSGALGARGMQSLQSYGQSESVYDNNAYTISSVYHSSSGTLQMFTSHPAQPGGPGSRPEYYMNQLGAYAMTHSPETFRQGAAAFRNINDWATEKRDEAITRANERANIVKGNTTAASFGPVFSSTTADSNEGPSVESFNQSSQTSRHEDGTTVGSEESETSSDPLTSSYTVPMKRSSKSSKRNWPWWWI